MDDYFIITRIRNEQQKLAYIGLCTEGKALEWWKANRHRYQEWSEVKEILRGYYGDHYQADKAYNDIVALKQTGSVQKYLNDLDKLNVYTEMTDHHLINIILNGIPSRLRLAMAHYEDLRSNPMRWKQKLLEMDVATTEFHHKDSNAKNEDKGKKHSFEDRTQLKRGDEPKDKPTFGESVFNSTKDKRRKEERCIKCGRKGHFLCDCKTGWRAKTLPPFIPNPTTKPALKKL